MGDTVDLGRTNDQVGWALEDMRCALNWMIQETNWSIPATPEVDAAQDDDLQMALCLDPGRISEEFDKVRKAAGLIGEEADVVVQLRATHDHLDGWKGTAADAFRAHLVRMEVFNYQTQHTALMVALQSLGALFAMAYHMRQSYYDMAKMVEAAAHHAIDENQKREDKLKLTIGVNFVKAALEMNPANVKSTAVDFVADTIQAAGDYAIEGDDADLVIAGYLECSRSLRQTFESNFEQVAKRLSDEYDLQLENESKLQALQPVNVASGGVTDVGGPKFSYAEFYTEEYPKNGPFVGQVDEERRKYAEEKSARQTEITERLEGRE